MFKIAYFFDYPCKRKSRGDPTPTWVHFGMKFLSVIESAVCLHPCKVLYKRCSETSYIHAGWWNEINCVFTFYLCDPMRLLSQREGRLSLCVPKTCFWASDRPKMLFLTKKIEIRKSLTCRSCVYLLFLKITRTTRNLSQAKKVNKNKIYPPGFKRMNTVSSNSWEAKTLLQTLTMFFPISGCFSLLVLIFTFSPAVNACDCNTVCKLVKDMNEQLTDIQKKIGGTTGNAGENRFVEGRTFSLSTIEIVFDRNLSSSQTFW